MTGAFQNIFNSNLGNLSGGVQPKAKRCCPKHNNGHHCNKNSIDHTRALLVISYDYFTSFRFIRIVNVWAI